MSFEKGNDSKENKNLGEVTAREGDIRTASARPDDMDKTLRERMEKEQEWSHRMSEHIRGRDVPEKQKVAEEEPDTSPLAKIGPEEKNPERGAA